MTGNDHAQLAIPDYVPIPDPAKADRLIGAQYFPGWKPGTHRGWPVLAGYPERKPLLGWYDESNPEVTDWEIKWALEHGIAFFLYCWYRNRSNMGKRVTVSDLRLGHAIHTGLFHSRYRDKFRFAIMWENQNAGNIASLDDLKENLVPFWIEEYFSKPFYLRYQGKLLLFVYDLESLIRFAGGVDGARRAVDSIREVVARQGLGELLILCEYRGVSREFLEKAKSCGFEAVFAYCWHPPQQFPTIAEAFDQQLQKLEAWKQYGVLPFMPTASVGWDPMPWSTEDPKTPWLNKEKVARWYSTPEQYRRLLERVKAFADTFPEGSPMRSVLLLDNWNEWSEGHFISPHAGGGFGYLQSVRNVFTDMRNLPDYRTPEQIGLGPYGPAQPDSEATN